MVWCVQDAGKIQMATKKAIQLLDLFQYVDGTYHLSLPPIHSGNPICNFNGGSLSSMGGEQEFVMENKYEKNKATFLAIEYYWHTVRIGYIREITAEVKIEIERIYKEQLDPTWLPNRYCKGCYFKAVQDLIYHFQL